MHDHLDRGSGAEGHPNLDDPACGVGDPHALPTSGAGNDPYEDRRHRARREEAWRSGMARRKRKDAERKALQRQAAEQRANRSKVVTPAMLYTTLDALDRAHSPTLQAQAKVWRQLVFRSAYGPPDERLKAWEALRRLFLNVLSDGSWSLYDHRAVRQFHGRVVLYRLK